MQHTSEYYQYSGGAAPGAQLDARPTGDQGFVPRRAGNIVDIDHEIFPTIILFLLLIVEGQLSVSGERPCT